MIGSNTHRQDVLTVGFLSGKKRRIAPEAAGQTAQFEVWVPRMRAA
jgi:hypothetical protein